MQRTEYRRLTSGFVVAALVVCVAIYVAYRTANRFDPITREQITLVQSADDIRYLDEVLTMSARMGAFTSDPAWEKRYLEALPQLDQAIATGKQTGNLQDDPLAKVDQANNMLIELETRAFALVNDQQPEQASALLHGDTYLDNKRIYAEGLNQFVADLAKSRQAIEQSFKGEILKAGLLLLAMLALIAYIVYRMYQIMSRRLELETALGNVAQRLLSPRPDNFNEEIRWVLELLANKSRADSAWLVYRQTGTVPRLIKVWHHYRNPCDDLNVRNITTALRYATEDEGGQIVLQAEQARQAKIGDQIAVTSHRENQHEYMLCLLGKASGQLDWSAEDSSVLLNIDEIIVRAIESQQQKRLLQKLATTDGLTGLLNRREFDLHFQEEWQRCKTTPIMSALLMLDIDWFKNINDRYGHAAGDDVLAAVAKVFKSQIRGDDIVGRVGGEEFGVILPSSLPENALETAERLRQTIERSPIQTSAGEICITLSIGVTLFKCDDASIDSVAKRADDALYVSKNAGRNRVTLR